MIKPTIMDKKKSDYRYTRYSTIETSHAKRYLTRLCKHFSHKVSVTVEEGHGYIDFAIGTCEILVDNHALAFYCASNQPQDLDDIIATIDRHLAQFAHQEKLLLSWQT